MIERKNACVITGTSGYVGRRIRDYFVENDWTVCELKHNCRSDESLVTAYSLEEEISAGVVNVLEKSNLLIHCAYDFRVIDRQSVLRVNVNGSGRLLNTAKRVGVKKVIVISTMSAFDGCKSLYGMAKLAIESEARKTGAIIVRPGLVFGKSAGGMVGTLERLVSRSRIVPLIGEGRQVFYLAHENDLCSLILKIATEAAFDIKEPIVAASEKGKRFKDILQILASINGKKLTFIPLPWGPAWGGVKLLELVRAPIGIRSDSIISLVNLNPMPSFELTKQIGVVFREFTHETAVV